MNNSNRMIPYSSISLPPIVAVNERPWPRKVSQKERRKKARYRRSQGIKRGK